MFKIKRMLVKHPAIKRLSDTLAGIFLMPVYLILAFTFMFVKFFLIPILVLLKLWIY